MWRSLFKNIMLLGVADVALKGLGFLLSIFLARVFSIEEFGQYSWAMAFVALFQFVIDFGFHTVATRDVSQKPERAAVYLSSLLRVKVIFLLASLVLSALAFVVLPNPSAPFLVVILSVLYAGMTSIAEFSRMVFRALDRFQWETVTKLIQGASVAGFGVGLAYVTKRADVTVAAMTLGAVISAAVTVVVARKHAGWAAYDAEIARNSIREAWPFALMMIFFAIYFKSDSVILGMYRGPEEVGYYTAAYQPILVLMSASHILMGALFPAVSRWAAKGELGKRLRPITMAVFFAGISASALVFLLREQIIRLLFGDSFAPSVEPLMWLAGISVFDFVVYWNAIILWAAGRQKTHVVVEAITAVANIGLNFWLIPTQGGVGAAKATLLAYVLYWAVSTAILMASGKRFIAEAEAKAKIAEAV